VSSLTARADVDMALVTVGEDVTGGAAAR